MLYIQKVWLHYKNCCQGPHAANLGLQPVAYRTFCKYWFDLLPYITVSKPRSDLCWTCHQNTTAIMKVVNKPDDEKAKVLNGSIHLNCIEILPFSPDN